jgi:hypothetical protein
LFLSEFPVSPVAACTFVISPRSTDFSRIENLHSTRTMSVTLPPLPYEYTALEPHISQRTLEIHHDKHHARYVAVANTMIAGTDLENADLVTIIKGTTNVFPSTRFRID